MKAKIKATGEMVEVIDIYPVEINDEPANPFVQYYRNKDREEVYGDYELDFNLSGPEKTVIEGYVARDERGGLYLHSTLPRKGISEWYSDCPPRHLSEDAFPSITWETGPRKVRIEISLVD